jgi:hypothetical protein
MCQWLTPIILATWEAEIRNCNSKSLGQIFCETLFWKYPTQKGLAEWPKWYSTYLASMRSWVQTLVLPKKEKKNLNCGTYYKGKVDNYESVYLVGLVQQTCRNACFLPTSQKWMCMNYFALHNVWENDVKNFIAQLCHNLLTY